MTARTDRLTYAVLALAVVAVIGTYYLGMLTVAIFAAGRIKRLERENERLRQGGGR